MNGYPDRDGRSGRRKEDLLGNGTLTVLARLSAVGSAAVLAILTVLSGFFLPKAWDFVVELNRELKTVQLYIAGATSDAKAHAGEHADMKRRLDNIENRVVYRGTP